ncbi:hypothetical protein F2Q69_00050610 [Brassica cretica]|uniref:Uncharacterized protein n=1 Tax=Brassica cretica TaxID=69181 RepID=A0A8S9PZW0_BRACR|nr:hypothetical protein F2Q69_00050610 [Brassica cretica]
MAANGVRRALHSSSSTGRILFSRSSSVPKLGKSAGFAFGNGSSSSRSSLRRLTSSRLDLAFTSSQFCQRCYDNVSESKEF